MLFCLIILSLSFISIDAGVSGFDDPSRAGPYAVGRRVIPGTITSRNLTLEIWYPSSHNATIGKPAVVYDLREHLPEDMVEKLKGTVDELGIRQTCDMYSENVPCYDSTEFLLPETIITDTVNYPGKEQQRQQRPVILFIHGTGGWRGQSLQLNAHWASRGFVVIAADYPGINLKDMLEHLDFHKHGKVPNVDQSGDTILLYNFLQEAQQQAINTDTDHDPINSSDSRFDFFIKHVNLSHVAIIGHSAGAFAVDELSEAGVGNVFIPMAGSGTNITMQNKDGPSADFLRNYTTLILGGQNDTIDTGGATRGWETTAGPPKAPSKRFALVKDLGHHFCSDICAIGAPKGGIVKIAEAHGIWQAAFMSKLANNGCKFQNPAFADPEQGWKFVNYASSAVLEEYFYQDLSMKSKLEAFQQSFPKMVLQYKEAL